MSIGNRELNLRVKLAEGQDMREGCFKVTRMRCWRITTLHNVSKGFILLGDGGGYFYMLLVYYIMCVIDRIQVQLKPCLKFLFRAVDLNSKLKKIVEDNI